MKELLESLSPSDREWHIARQLDPKRMPAHIAIIMDGNGRWARQRNFPRLLGHKAGIEAVRTTVETCALLGLEALTLYAFSVENWKRPIQEVEGLWRLLRLYLRHELATLMRNNIRLCAIGRLEALPVSAQNELQDVMAKTAHNQGMRLNLAINYGGRSELVDAVNAVITNATRQGKLESLKITEDAICSHLYTGGLKDPDLLIRTSGEMRISNFLLWQIAYSEFYVTETLWPDFNRQELLRAILDYQNRDRRFGGLNRTSAIHLESPAIPFEEEILELPIA